MQIEFVCEVCKEFVKRDRSPKQLAKANPRFCSLKCAGQSHRGPGSPRWVEGQRRINGYIRVYVPNHPNCDKRGFVLEHRIVMERTIGRYLESGEVVHHINGVRDDNRPENLARMLFGEHSAMHWPDALLVIAIKKRWGNGYDCCRSCKTSERKHQARGLCKRCYDTAFAKALQNGEWCYGRHRSLG